MYARINKASQLRILVNYHLIGPGWSSGTHHHVICALGRHLQILAFYMDPAAVDNRRQRADKNATKRELASSFC